MMALTSEQLGAALRDLAEHGWVLLDTKEDAEQVRRAAPVATVVEQRVYWDRVAWMVRATGRTR